MDKGLVAIWPAARVGTLVGMDPIVAREIRLPIEDLIPGVSPIAINNDEEYTFGQSVHEQRKLRPPERGGFVAGGIGTAYCSMIMSLQFKSRGQQEERVVRQPV